MQVNCDSCKKEFELVLRTNRLPGDGAVDLHFFICPHCSKEYAAGYTNTEIRAKQQAVARLRGRLARTKDLKKSGPLEIQIKKIQAEIAVEMDALKADFQEEAEAQDEEET